MRYDKVDQTKIFMSFGAAVGGMDFIMQLRQDIYQTAFAECQGKDLARMIKENPYFCYLDAFSLASHPQTSYIKYEKADTSKGTPADTYKMDNTTWDVNYRAAIQACDVMVFFFTRQWLASPYCKDEFKWLGELRSSNPPSAIAVINNGDKWDVARFLQAENGLRPVKWRWSGVFYADLDGQAFSYHVEKGGADWGSNECRYGCDKSARDRIIRHLLPINQ